ncbi:polysaccharide deacetylase family protein [Pseudoxanthobacter sp. M-2]|uniref:polysaccharide deacetylase family protein n=1 Tax=Pseudoxanthobacter sp. M-2 TaxID=3078754 RepID=UPI0038FCB1F9
MNLDAPTLGEGLRGRLDALAAAGRTISLWWRDDDAALPEPALDRLIALSDRLQLPLVLAVIPEPAQPSLAERLARPDAVHVTVVQHGWRHANHEPTGARAAELGGARPVETVLGELTEGRSKLAALFGQRFLPVLTPPWNRVDAEVARRRGEVGLPGLSTFTSLERAGHRLDPHLDPIVWKTTRSYMGDERMLMLFDEQVAARTGEAADVPIGVLSHHLSHDEPVWAFLEAFLATTAGHPAVRWPSPPALFGFDGPG